MKPTNVKLLKGLSAAALLAGANLAMAETVTIPATVTVNNAINFTSTGSLNFGTVRSIGDTTASECAGLTIPVSASATPPTAPVAASGGTYATTCTGAGSAVVQAVGGTPARPILTIAGVAPFTTLNLTVPNAAVDLTAASVPPGSAKFQVLDFTAVKTSGTAALITLTAGAGTFQTDAGGGATLQIGGTLITDPGTPSTGTYQDLAYSGTFNVTVAY